MTGLRCVAERERSGSKQLRHTRQTHLKPAASLITKHTRMSALVNSKSALDRFLTLLLRQRSRKKMATLNEHTAAILSDISDGSDTNFIYILSANE